MAKKPTSKKGNTAEAAKNIRKAEKMSHDLQFEISMPFELKPRHQQLVDLALAQKSNVVFVDGPAGTAKTYCAVLVALEALLRRYKDKILYVRSIVESADKKIGSLPGEVEDKFMPWSIPLVEKLEEMIEPDQIQPLFDNHYVKCWPMNFLRGVTFRNNVVIIDEAQNLTHAELTTAITRFGENCKLIIIGDTRQADIGIGKSGFRDIYEEFAKEKYKKDGIFTFRFEIDDIMRSPLLAVLVEGLEAVTANNQPPKPKPTVRETPIIPSNHEGSDWGPSA